MFKRLAAASSVTALIVLGAVSGASADPADVQSQVVAKVTTKQSRLIDWDAHTRSSGTGYSAQRIDWD
ncbi:MAG: hypothetical protein JWP31_2255 [Aeromicrobium sp.]|nr:hypothetical protein [Aeromicrobium sp.]